MHARSLPCPYNPPPPTAPVLGGAGGTPPAPSFPPFLWEEMGAPAGQAPAGRPSLHRAGGYYPPLQGTAVATRRVGVFHGGAPSEWSEDGRARRVVAPHEVSGCGGKRADTRRECPDAGRYRSFALILSSAAFSCLADLANPTAHTITIAMTQRLPVAIYSVVFPARLMKTNSAAMTAGRTAPSSFFFRRPRWNCTARITKVNRSTSKARISNAPFVNG